MTKEQSDKREKSDTKKPKTPKYGAGIALGIGVGIAVGSSIGNVGAGLAIGIAIGIAYDANARKKHNSENSDE